MYIPERAQLVEYIIAYKRSGFEHWMGHIFALILLDPFLTD